MMVVIPSSKRRFAHLPEKSLQRAPRNVSFRFATYLSVALVGLNLSITGGLTTAAIPVVALLPVWWTTIRNGSRLHKLWFVCSGFALVSGALLFIFQPYDNPHSYVGAVVAFAYLGTHVGAAGVVLWSLAKTSVLGTVSAFAAGMICDFFISGVPISPEAWKFQLAIPVTLLLLVALKNSSLFISILLLMGIAAISFAADARSFSAFCLLTIALVSFSTVSRKFVSPKMSNWGRLSTYIIAMAAISFGLYRVVSTAILNGTLGAELALRTKAQLVRSTSLLDSGRPEWRIALELAKMKPLGIGPGAVPTRTDVSLGNAGLRPIGLSAQSNYFSNYVFGGTFKLHSIISDLWVSFGLGGLLLAAFIIGIIILSLVSLLTSGLTTTGLACGFVGICAVWYMLFGPFFTNLPLVCFATALAIHVKATDDARLKIGRVRCTPQKS